MFERLGNRLGVADTLWALAMLEGIEGDPHAKRQADESVRQHRELGDAFGLVDAQEQGRAAFELELEVARSSFLETLEGLAPVGYRTGVAIALDALAALEIRLGHPVKALRLAGAAEALKEAAGGQVPPEFAYPDPRPAARTALPRSIASAWAEGRAMSLDEAVAYAGADPGPDER